MAKLFRCTNPACDPKGRFHFAFTPTPDNMDPTCPKCGTKANDPKFGQIIGRLVAIHFDPASHIPGIGMGTRACDPKKSVTVNPAIVSGLGAPNPFHGATGDVDQVNCPECRASDAWKAAFFAVYGDEKPGNLAAALGRLQMFVHA